MDVVVVMVTCGTICFKYRRKKSARQIFPLVAAMYLCLLETIRSAAFSKV